MHSFFNFDEVDQFLKQPQARQGQPVSQQQTAVGVVKHIICNSQADIWLSLTKMFRKLPTSGSKC